MANIRIKDLPADSAPKADDKVPIDLGTTRNTTVEEFVFAGRPTATKTEAETGTDNKKAMTPLAVKQAIDAQTGMRYVPVTRRVDSGTGLSGGQELTGDVTLSLNSASVASLAKADSAVQSVNGKSGNSVTLVKSDVGLGNADNTSDLLKPISTATQAALNGKFDSPTGDTSQYIRGNGTLATFPAIPQGTVTSVGVSVPTGLSAGGSPVTGAGTIAITYSAGYQGYTTVEATKLSGVASGATANQTDAYLLSRANHTGEQAISTVTGLQAGLDAKANAAITITAGAGLTGGGTLAANRTIALSSTSIASLALADTSVQPARTIAAGAGLTGGGDLSANRTVSLNAASIASLAKADTSVQPSSLAAVATSGAYNDLTGRPTLGAMAAKNNVAISDIAATGTPNLGSFLRGDGTWSPVAGAGTVTSVAMTVPTGLAIAGSPITGAGTLAVSYATGYQGYTSAEASKLAGVETGAQVNTVTSVAGKTGVITLAKADVGLGNVANKSEAQMVASGAIADALISKLNADAQAADSAKLGNETAAQWQAKIDAKAGFYAGSNQTEVNYPIGQPIIAWDGQINANALVVPYVNSAGVYTLTASGNTRLTGVWRSKGNATGTTLCQRVS